MVFKQKQTQTKNKFFIILVATVIIISFLAVSCSKSNDTNTSVSGPVDSNYVINGITDINMLPTDSTILALGVALLTSHQEKITLALSGLPANTVASFSATSGVPNFASILTIKTNKATSGVYPIKLTGTSASGLTRNYTFNLNINKIPGCADALVRGWVENCVCSPAGSHGANVDITKVDSTTIKFSRLGVASFNVNAKLNCANNTITLNDNWGTDYLTGSGYFSSDSIIVNYTYYDGITTNTCTSIFK